MSQENFIFRDEGEFWRATDVSYREQPETVDLLKNLLYNGGRKTQDQTASLAVEAMQRGKFYTPDFQLQHSLFASMFENRNGEFEKEIEAARTLIDKLIHDRSLSTLTRLRYNPSGLVEVIHSYNTPNQVATQISYESPSNGFYAQNPEFYKNLFGTESIEEINNVYQWLTGAPTKILILNYEPKKIIERAAGIVANPDKVGISFDAFPNNRSTSLGFRIFKDSPQEA